MPRRYRSIHAIYGARPALTWLATSRIKKLLATPCSIQFRYDAQLPPLNLIVSHKIEANRFPFFVSSGAEQPIGADIDIGPAPYTTTPWERVCCSISRIKGTRRYFFRHWEICATVPLFVAIGICFLMLSYFTCVFPHVRWRVASAITVLLPSLLFLASYLATVLSDPGFLPFNWIETQRTQYSWEDQLAGLATTDEQFAFMKKSGQPERAVFSKSFGRFVLEGHHICGWTANWIGKRNRKQYILMSLYGAVMMLTLIVWTFVAGFTGPGRTTRGGVMCAIALLMEVFFGTLLVSVFIEAAVELFNGTVKRSQGDRCRDVFGDGPCMFYPCPTPAFAREDEQLRVDWLTQVVL